MMPCTEKIQVFVEMNYNSFIKYYVINYNLN